MNIFQPSLGQEEVDALAETFKTNWIGRGPKTKAFEKAWADHIGVAPELMQSVSTCTEGLFAAMEVIELREYQNVVMPSISFVGAANAVLTAGGDVKFCDVQYRSLNPSLDHIKEAVDDRTRAVVLLHYGGVPCKDLDDIAYYCSNKGIYLIEDCACAPASTFRGVACGNWGDIGIWSFDAMKIMSTGDGGMIYTADKVHAELLSSLLFFGLNSTSGFTSKAKERWWEFDVVTPGRNAVMNDITSTIGLVQLRKLAGFVEQRKHLYERYSARLQGLDWLLTPPPIPFDAKSSYYLYWVQTEVDTRDALAAYLRENGVYVTFRYYPLHRVPMYNQERAGAELKGANAAADSTLCLPLHQALTDDDIDKACDLILTFGRTYERTRITE